jgi:hypothetical protein
VDVSPSPPETASGELCAERFRKQQETGISMLMDLLMVALDFVIELILELVAGGLHGSGRSQPS